MNREGMTLIEIVLAIALIGIIAVTLLPSMTSAYSMLSNTKKFTIDSFEAQEDIEKIMEEARKSNDESQLFDKVQGKGMNIKTKEISVFGGKINGYEIEKDINENSKLNVFVAGTRPPESKVPAAIEDSVTIKAVKNNDEVSYIYGAESGVSIIGDYSINEDTKKYLLTTLRRWYVSKPGFYPVIPEKYDEIDAGKKYPTFPYDYELIDGQSSRKISDLSKYPDRHIVCSVIPVSKIGKYGVEVNSNSLWVIGLPIVNGLNLHLDASWIEEKDGIFDKWNDLTNINKSVKLLDPQKLPIVLESDFGKVLKTGKSGLIINDNGNIRSDELTVFIVVKNSNNESYGEQNIISKKSNWYGTGWELCLNPNGAKMRYTFQNNIKYELPYNLNLGEDKHIIMASFDRNRLYLQIDGKNIAYKNKYYYERYNYEPIIIGGENSDIEISEIIIYAGKVDFNTEGTKIVDYLKNKHIPKK